MGFQTLNIEKRSSDVRKLLAAVKTDFIKYGEVLAKVQKKLEEASNIIDKEVAVRARAINRKLRSVEELPTAESRTVLMLDVSGADVDGDLEEGP